MLLDDLFEDSPRDRFERTPPVTGKLVIFDIDDTLVNTTTKVGVRRDGELIKQLNSHDFTHYELQPGEEFDFGGFRDAREFFTQARPIPGMMQQLKRDIESGNKVIMLTARSDFNDRDVFLDTFRQYGIDMDRIHVYRAGNLVTRAATEEKKKIILKHLLGKHAYEKVIMYDDSVPNLNAFLSLKQDFPYTEFYAWHVDPSGRADEYHRTGLNEDAGSSYPAWRIRFQRFKDLPAVIPEREGRVYLMPTDTSALKTFYSLTGKDFTKINNMPTEAYRVSGSAMVGDMHTINYLINAIKELKHWRSAWTPESVEKREKYIEELKQEYLDGMVPLSQYQPGQFSMPEILAEPGQIQPMSRSVVYDKNTGDIVLRPRSGTSQPLDEVSRRGFLTGLAAFAAVSAMPPGVVKALSTPDGIQGLSVGDVSSLLKAIRAYLPPYDQEDWTGTFERWDDMAAALRIHGDDNDVGADKLDRLLRLYRRNPESASTTLLNHLKKHAVDLTDVRGKTIDQWDDVETVRKADDERSEWQQLQQQFADYFAKQDKQPSISQAQTVATAATAFRDLVQRVIDAGQTAAAAPPREKYMGRIEPTSSAPALPAPDRSAADIMAQLRDVVGRDLTDAERAVVAQEVGRTETNEGLRDTLAGLALGAGVAMSGGAEAKTEKMVVSPGQTVYSIAQAFDTTPQAIQRANRLDSKMTIRPGQTLVIPQPGVKRVNKPGAKASQPAQAKKMRTLTGTMTEALLQRTALQAGIQGIELAAFLSQTKHESWNFTRMTEQRSDASAERMYGRKYNPAKAKELGNIKHGDGARYKGRGYIQLTGRDNYYRAGRALGLDLVRNPTLAAKPEIAAKIAVWYWKNRVAPKVNDFSDVRAVTRPINKGLDQLEKRQAAFLAYVNLLGLEGQA